jgi:preprotein translocase subunit SecG
MKQMKKVRLFLVSAILSLILAGGILYAQEEGTYIDNASPQDSSYMEGDVLNFDEYYEDDKSGNTVAIVVVAAIVVAGIVIAVVLRKKKKA